MPKLNKSKHRPWIPKRKRISHLTDNSAFYNSRKWRSLRNYYIQMNPLCEQCKREDKVTAGQCVDHIKPIRLGGLLLCVSNLQTLCNPCHSVKSGKESQLETKITRTW